MRHYIRINCNVHITIIMEWWIYIWVRRRWPREDCYACFRSLIQYKPGNSKYGLISIDFYGTKHGIQPVPLQKTPAQTSFSYYQIFGYFAHLTTMTCDNFWTRPFQNLRPSPVILLFIFSLFVWWIHRKKLYPWHYPK